MSVSWVILHTGVILEGTWGHIQQEPSASVWAATTGSDACLYQPVALSVTVAAG